MGNTHATIDFVVEATTTVDLRPES